MSRAADGVGEPSSMWTFPSTSAPTGFRFLSEGANCCRTRRFTIGRHDCTTLSSCAARCAANDQCRYFSHSEDWGGHCLLCRECELETGPWMAGHGQLLGIYHAYARETASHSTEALVQPFDEASLQEAENSTLSSRCRYDTAASSGEATRCRFKMEPDAALSAGGHSFEYYHFLIDLAPRIMHALRRDECTDATLLLPGWYPVQHVFRLQMARNFSTHDGWRGWDASSAAAVTTAAPFSHDGSSHTPRGGGRDMVRDMVRDGSSHTPSPRSTVPAAASLFGPAARHRLTGNFVERHAALCQASGRLIPFLQVGGPHCMLIALSLHADCPLIAC